MNKKHVVIFIALGCTACAPAPYSQPPSRSNPYANETVEQYAARWAGTQPDTSQRRREREATIKEAEQVIRELDASKCKLSALKVKTGSTAAISLGIGYPKNSAMEKSYFEQSANMMMRGANAMLQVGCLTEADELYREVMSTSEFTAADRDRARIGIDDVRQARAQHEAAASKKTPKGK